MSDTTTEGTIDVVAPPSADLSRLSPLVGQWAVEGYAQASLAGPAGPVKSHETFEWLDGGYFLVHRYETYFAAQPVQRGVMFWGYDEATQGFLLHFFSNNGPFTKEGNIYEGRIGDGVMVCTGPARFTVALDDYGRIKVGNDQSFTIAWELRDAKGIWRPWARDTYRRVR